MYAVIETGGKQYRVEPGDVLTVEKLKVAAGEKIEFDRVLAFSDDNALQTGAPYLDAVRVAANVLENGKGEKIVVFKFKAKKDYRKKQGHRQPYTKIEIDSFLVDGKEVAKKSDSPAPVQAEETAADAEKTKEEKEKKPARKAAKPKVETKADDAEEKPVKKPAKPKTEKAPETEAAAEAPVETPAAEPAADETAEKTEE